MNYINLSKKLFWKNKSLPIYFIFFVTNRCNARCNHCFYWRKINNKTSDMTLEEIKKFSKSMGVLYHVNLTGGEPFLRNDLHEIVYIFHKNCKVRSFGISTNGYNPNRIYEITNRIIEIFPDINLQVNISLDHLNEIHDDMRGSPGLFNNAIRTIRGLKELKPKKIIVGINLTLMKENEKEIKKIYTFVRDVFQPDRINPLLLRGEPRDINTKNVSFESYKELIWMWIEDIRSHKFRGHRGLTFSSLLTEKDILLRKIIINEIQKKRNYFRCLAGVLGGVMYGDGEVFPCELFPESFGNIRDYNYDFKKIWFSVRAEKIRTKIRKERCWCTHECFLGLNILFNFKGLYSLFKKWGN